MAKPKKKRNPTDATMRNVRAQKKQLDRIEKALKAIKKALKVR